MIADRAADAFFSRALGESHQQWLKVYLLLALSLCQCARTIGADPARASLQTYVGHPVSELIARFGLSLAWTVKNTHCLEANSWQRHSRRL